MNAITTLPSTSLALPVDATFDQWVDAGRNLATMKRDLGFMIGDWVNHGREHFGEQIEMALECSGMDSRFALRAANVAKAFPDHCRNHELSFEHHKAVMKLPRPEQLDLLRIAGDRHWKPQELKEAVVKRRYERGEDFEDEDINSYMQSQIIRAWNRATPEARKAFMELAIIAKMGIIDEDRVYVEQEG